MTIDSLAGFSRDHNTLMDRFTVNDGDTVLTLEEWRQLTGQDQSTHLATANELFADWEADDYYCT